MMNDKGDKVQKLGERTLKASSEAKTVFFYYCVKIWKGGGIKCSTVSTRTTMRGREVQNIQKMFYIPQIASFKKQKVEFVMIGLLLATLQADRKSVSCLIVRI